MPYHKSPYHNTNRFIIFIVLLFYFVILRDKFGKHLKSNAMGVKIGSISSYLYLDTWIMANIIHLSTIDYCQRYLNLQNDPCGRLYDQMTQAARSVAANIAEGSSRHQTSRETEMKLLDVARASLSELSYDYMCQLMKLGKSAWPHSNPEWAAVHAVKLSRPQYSENLMHDVTNHIISQKHLFDRWLQSEDMTVRINAMLILCGRLIRMMQRQIEVALQQFKHDGGFTENLTAERIEAKARKSAGEGAPVCPRCGKAMIKRTARKGINSGRQFWSCMDYPNCNGTRNLVQSE